MASAKSSNPGKKGKNAKNAKSESKSSGKLKETKKQTTKVKSRRNKKKQNQSNKRDKIPNGVAVVPVSSSDESGEESTSEVEEVAVDNQITSSNGRITKAKAKASKGKKKNIEEEEGEEERGTIAFPMNRIRTIVKGQDSELRLSNEAVFVINKATEKFVDLFTQDAYACCVEDRKKSLAYKYLASVVSKQRKYDFLSDFVPQQVMAEDALRERNSAEQAPL